jgi:hemoglobin/transferrin/lactoferrin receptor protein
MPRPLRPLTAPNPLTLAVLAACAALGAHAAEEAPALSTVTVTAKGYAADDLQTPGSSAAFEREEIVASGAQNVGELLRGEPGLAVASDGAQGQNPAIRGLKRESVVLLVDGMRLNSAQPAGAIASFMSLGLADRVEVVKGPSSVLYGTGALGGAINVLLPQARFEPGVRFDAAAGYDSASKGLRGTGVVNLAQGDHALMAGVSLAHLDDYKSPNGTVPRTGYDSESFIGQYRFRIDGQQQLRASYQQHTDEDVWYPGSTKFVNPVVGSTTVRSPKQERTLAELGYSRKGAGEAPLNIDVRVWRQEMERQIWSHASGLGRENSKTRVSFTTDGLDARADWLAHPQHLVSFGANAWRMEASPERYVAGAAPTFTLGRNDPFSNGQIDAFGVYVQDDMRFGKLNVLAALRHDTVEGSAASMNNGAVTGGLARRDSAFSGSLGAIYEISPLLRPYVTLSRGFRAGEMRERYEASPRGDGYYYVGNPQIKPETATQLEIGVKGQNEQAAWQVAAYRNRISDYITGRVTGAVINGMQVKATENIGRVTLTGFEAQGRLRVAAGHWLNAGLSILRGDNDTLDEPLFQMPADELSLGWEGRVAEGWTADVTGRFVRRQDRVATIFAQGTENATPGFVTADLGATYRWQKQSLRVALKNLADKAYHEHLAEGVSGQEILAPGRSLQLTWKGSF